MNINAFMQQLAQLKSRGGDISEDLEKLMNKTDDERVKDEIRRLMDRM